MAVNEEYDIQTIGTYDRKGNVFLDRTASKLLTQSERAKVIAHEKIEHRLRTQSNLSYEQAHERALEQAPWEKELGQKLHKIADWVSAKTLRKPPPSYVMNGATGQTEFGSFVETKTPTIPTDLAGRSLAERKTKFGRVAGFFPHVRGSCLSCKHKIELADKVFKDPVGRYICPICGGKIQRG